MFVEEQKFEQKQLKFYKTGGLMYIEESYAVLCFVIHFILLVPVKCTYSETEYDNESGFFVYTEQVAMTVQIKWTHY